MSLSVRAGTVPAFPPAGCRCAPDPRAGTAAAFRAAWSARIEAALAARIARDCPLAAPARYVLSTKGKRVRPLLVLATAEAVGGTAEGALAAAAAVEFLHASSLILDDLPRMDDAWMRRGEPALHRVFDEAGALLTAILFLNEAYGICADLPGQAGEAVQAVVRCIGQNGMVSGQARDLAGGGQNAETMQLKTGALFRLSVELGMLMGAPSSREAAALRGYADACGLTVQLCDDIADGDWSDGDQTSGRCEMARHCARAIELAGHLRPSAAAQVLASIAGNLTTMPATGPADRGA